MPALSIRQVSEATHQALRIRAAKNGRSTEAEVRSILEAAVANDTEGLGTRLAAAARRRGCGPGLPEPAKGKPMRAASFD
jgi:antitoxin FitA